MPRIRELSIYESALPPGPRNAISDVAGVTVGHFTLIAGTSDTGPAWRPGSGPFRTGVTLVIPHGGNLYQDKVVAAIHTINGFGKPHGFEQVRELGLLETPIALTGTLNVPRVANALITLAIEHNPHIGVGFASSGWGGYSSVNPLVGETSDAYLSDLQGRPIGLSEVRAALAAASAEVAEGAVGAGTGTSCYGWKGGIGTASRVLPGGEELTPRRLRPFAPLGELPAPGGYTVGALVQTNMGRAEELTICGVPMGRYLRPPEEDSRGQVTGASEERSDPGTSNLEPGPSPQGSSIMIVLATDAPLDSRGLGRLAARAAFGLARTGTPGHGGSGDFVIAFSTAATGATIHEQPLMDAFALAVVESVEEAIYNSLLMAHTVVGRQGHTRHALPADEVARLVRGHRTF